MKIGHKHKSVSESSQFCFLDRASIGWGDGVDGRNVQRISLMQEVVILLVVFVAEHSLLLDEFLLPCR